METENKSIKSGENFKWIKLHIDETLMTTTVTIGNDALKWKYILLLFYYGKNETKLSYKKASSIIGEKALKKLIEYEDVLLGEEMIRIPQGDNNWKTFTKTKDGNSRGGFNKAANDRERAKYRAEDLLPNNLKKMKEDELEKVIKLFPHLKSIDTGMIL